MPETDPRHAGCCVWHHEGLLGSRPEHCVRPVAWAGAIEYTYPKPHRVPAFACDEHRDALHTRRPYGEHPEHELEMERRRERDRLQAEERARRREQRDSQWAV